MNIMQTGVAIGIQSIGWALLHSLWQGLLLFGLLSVLLKLMPGMSSRLKYNLSLLTFAGCFVWFIDTGLRYWFELQNSIVAITEAVGQPQISHRITSYTHTTGGHLLNESFFQSLESSLPFVVFIYAFGVVFMTSRLCYNFMRVRRFRTEGIVAPSEMWLGKLDALRTGLGIAQPVKLLFSELINVPVVIGALKPVILIPLATVNGLSRDELEAILLHELAHVRRFDYLVNIVQTAIETILFFNPFIWLISAIIRRERENSCDDLVLDHVQQPLHYAKALATLESLRQVPLAMAAAGNRKLLFNRIKRIMEMKKYTNYNPLLVTFVLLAGLCISVFFLSPVLAQSKKDREPPKAAKKEIKKEKVVIIDNKNSKREYNSLDEIPEFDKKKLAEIEKMISDVDLDIVTKASIEASKAAVAASRSAIAHSKTIMAEQGKHMTDVDRKVLAQAELELEKAEKELKQIDLGGMSREIDVAMRDLDEESGKKKIEVRKTIGKEEGREANDSYEQMLDKMEGDGLISREKGFKIEKNGGELYINDELQSAAIFNKYRAYMDGEKIVVKGNNRRLTINAHK